MCAVLPSLHAMVQGSGASYLILDIGEYHDLFLNFTTNIDTHFLQDNMSSQVLLDTKLLSDPWVAKYLVPCRYTHVAYA